MLNNPEAEYLPPSTVPIVLPSRRLNPEAVNPRDVYLRHEVFEQLSGDLGRLNNEHLIGWPDWDQFADVLEATSRYYVDPETKRAGQNSLERNTIYAWTRMGKVLQYWEQLDHAALVIGQINDGLWRRDLDPDTRTSLIERRGQWRDHQRQLAELSARYQTATMLMIQRLDRLGQRPEIKQFRATFCNLITRKFGEQEALNRYAGIVGNITLGQVLRALGVNLYPMPPEIDVRRKTDLLALRDGDPTCHFIQLKTHSGRDFGIDIAQVHHHQDADPRSEKARYLQFCQALAHQWGDVPYRPLWVDVYGFGDGLNVDPLTGRLHRVEDNVIWNVSRIFESQPETSSRKIA